jgi:soluble lytic murein transglycosylase-like protein
MLTLRNLFGLAGMSKKKNLSVFQCFLAFALSVGIANAHSNGVYATTQANGRVSYTNAPLSNESVLLFKSNPSARVPSPKLPTSNSKNSKAHPAMSMEVNNHIQYAASLHDIEANLIAAVIRVESGFNRSAVSPKGARGLMQLMPATAERYGAFDLHDVRTNVLAGTAYLRDLILMFDGRLDLALAGYNAGENAVRKYNNRIPPYPETKHYVSAVLAEYRRLIRAG